MTRYEIILRFADDVRTHRNHAFTFLALTEMWATRDRPDSFELDFGELIHILKTKRSTLFDWLRQLESCGYIELRRAANQREKTTVKLYPNRPAVTEFGRQLLNPDSTSTNRVEDSSKPVTEIGQLGQVSDGSLQNRTAESAQLTFKRGFSVLSTTSPSVLMHNNNHLIKESDSYSKGDKSNGYDGKRVQGKNQSSRKKSLPSCPFSESKLADLTLFCNTLQAEYPTADLLHYHARLLNWRDRKGAVPKRANWLSTAKTFLLNDYRDGKLVTVTSIKPLNTHANRNRGHSLIEPQPDPDRRFGTW